MAYFIVLPSADVTAGVPTTFANATFTLDVSSPAVVSGLSNGTAYRAFEYVISPQSAEFTPVAPVGSQLWEFDFDGTDSPSALLNGRNIFDGGTSTSPSFAAITPTTNGTTGVMAFNDSTGSDPKFADFDMTDAEEGTSYTFTVAWAMNYVSGAAKTATTRISWRNDALTNLGTIFEEVDGSTATDRYILDGDVVSTMPVGATFVRFEFGPSGGDVWGGFNGPIFYVECVGQDNVV